MRHVAIGVDHHQKGNSGDNDQHQRGDVVNGKAHVYLKVTSRSPL